MDKQTLIYRLRAPLSASEVAAIFARYGSVHDVVVRSTDQAKCWTCWGSVTMDSAVVREVVAALGSAGQWHSPPSTDCPSRQQRPASEAASVQVWIPCLACRYSDFCTSVIQEENYPFRCSFADSWRANGQ